MEVGDAQPHVSPGDQVCISFLEAHKTKNHLQYKLKMRTGQPRHRTPGTHHSSRSQLWQGCGGPSFGTVPLGSSFSRTIPRATDQPLLQAEDKTSTLNAAGKQTRSIAPDKAEAHGFHAHTQAGLVPAHKPLEDPPPPQPTSASQGEATAFTGVRALQRARHDHSSSTLLGFASRSEEVNFCSLRATLTYVLTIYRCFAHLICSTIHKNMQLPQQLLHYILSPSCRAFSFLKTNPTSPLILHVIFDISSSHFRKHKNRHKCNENNSLFSKVYLSFPFMNRFSLQICFI